MLKEWRQALVFVTPATVIKWHRKGFQYYWRRKSRSKPGRPPIAMAIITLIRRMSSENITWGAPRIVAELALLGHKVAESHSAVRHLDSQLGVPIHSVSAGHSQVPATGAKPRIVRVRRSPTQYSDRPVR